MEQDKAQLTAQLLEAIEDLPAEQLPEVLDFVGYLRAKYGQSRRFKRGSPEAILRDLDEHGPLVFEPGELDRLLAEIDEDRALDCVEPINLDGPGCD